MNKLSTKRVHLSLQNMIRKALPHESFNGLRVEAIMGDSIIVNLYSEIVDTEIIKGEEDEPRRVEHK